MTYLRLIAALAVAAVLVAACGSHSGAGPSAAPPSPWHADIRPPEARNVPVQLRFIAKTLDGQDFHGADLVGKPAVLWFWTPWCPTCQGEAPMVGRVAAAHPGVTFIGVAGLDQVPAMKEFVDKYKLQEFRQLADADGTVWAKFGVTRQPAFAFIHPDSSIDVVKGPLSEPDLTQRVTGLPNQ
ncbi:thiol:disulfide interchange protein [Mycobacterium gordonae]|nr:protein disulfide oxidoreductase [Mycobacterium gordonae]OBJ80879.1 thiol:disulfide interchange protein [Mycobacterium gordonae]